MITDERKAELKQVAVDIHAGLVFTDRHIPPDSPPQALGMVFMPLMLGAEPDWDELGESPMLYEYLEKAAPRSVSGLPCFFSFRILNTEEAEFVASLYEQIRDAIKTI